jgi:O-antigen/teichoic acid export membrane protein
LEADKVARGTLYIAAQNVIQYLAAFIFYAVIARILPQADVGKITLLVFMMTLFSTLTQLAIPVASEKFISEYFGQGLIEKASAVAHTTFKLTLAIPILPLAALVLLSPNVSTLILGAESDALPLSTALLTAFMLNITSLYGANMLGLGMFAEMALQNLTYVIIGKSSAILLAFIGYGVNGVVAGWLIGELICLLVTYVLVKGKFKRSSERFPAGKVILYSYPIYVCAVLALFQGWADVTILYALTSNLALTGVYYLSVAGSSVLSIIWSAVAATIFPLLSARYGKLEIEGVSKAVSASMRYLNILVIPAGVSLAAISRTAITIAYGPAYLNGAIPFALLTATAILPAYAALLVTAIQAIGETRPLLKIGAASTLADVAVVAALAKPLGVVGAALARVAMLAVTLALSYCTLRSKVKLALDASSLKKALLASAALAAPMALGEWLFINVTYTRPLIRLLIDAALFAGIGLMALIKLRPLTIEDFELLKQTLPKRLHGTLDFMEKTSIKSAAT